MTVFTTTLTDGPSIAGLTPVGFGDKGLFERMFVHVVTPCGLGTSLSDRVKITPLYRLGSGQVMIDGVHVADVTPNVAFMAGVLLSEIVNLHETLSTSSIYHAILTNSLSVRRLLSLAIPKVLTENLTIADVAQIAQTVSIIQKLKLKDTPNVTLTYGLAILQTLSVFDSFANFFGGDLSDALDIAPTINIQFQAVAGLAQSMTLASVLGQSLIVRFDLSDKIALDDANILKMIYAGDPLLDGIAMRAAYVDPGGDFTTWAINTRTGAVTEYQNFVFNSIARMGNRFLGADQDGLWLLDGDQDDTTNIATQIKSGWMQLSGSRFTSFKAAYLGLRVQDDASDFFLKLHAGDGREYVYAVKPQNMQTTKVNMGKGLRSRYFSFELVTTGADFDLDSIEFVPISSQRRV